MGDFVFAIFVIILFGGSIWIITQWVKFFAQREVRKELQKTLKKDSSARPK